MRKLGFVVFAVVLLGLSAVAQATPVQFTVSSIQVTDTNSYNFTYTYPTTLPSFLLDTGGSTLPIDLFQISSSNDFDWYPGTQSGSITLNLQFSSPSGLGMTDGGTLKAIYNWTGDDQGTITWTTGVDPVTVNFGNNNTGQLRLDMANASFYLNSHGGSAWVPGTFTLVQAPTDPAPVPEPASMLLLGTGLLGLAGLARRVRR